MKKKFTTVFIAGLFALVSLTLVSACASSAEKSAQVSGNERGEAASNTMELVENDIKQLVLQINATDLALAAVINPEQKNIAEAYSTYSKNVANIEVSSARFLEQSEKMRLQGREYFDEWQKQGTTYSNPQIQALSEQRRAELGAVYAQIAESSVGVNGGLKSYVSNLTQMNTYFSTDLTPKGIEAIAPLAQSTIIDGLSLNASLDAVLVSIGAVRSELAPPAPVK